MTDTSTPPMVAPFTWAGLIGRRVRLGCTDLTDYTGIVCGYEVSPSAFAEFVELEIQPEPTLSERSAELRRRPPLRVLVNLAHIRTIRPMAPDLACICPGGRIARHPMNHAPECPRWTAPDPTYNLGGYHTRAEFLESVGRDVDDRERGGA